QGTENPRVGGSIPPLGTIFLSKTKIISIMGNQNLRFCVNHFVCLTRENNSSFFIVFEVK
ncbi:MAG: hypothetical protein LRZ93_04995, partial [Clostridiales bacterium]|nr:hypothetical protein [Clostridiales bacterium]